jgi:hypothetical protein
MGPYRGRHTPLAQAPGNTGIERLSLRAFSMELGDSYFVIVDAPKSITPVLPTSYFDASYAAPNVVMHQRPQG